MGSLLFIYYNKRSKSIYFYGELKKPAQLLYHMKDLSSPIRR